MSLGETGARRASASSWAFWLTLLFLLRMFWKASDMLFCRPWRVAPLLRAGVHRELLLSLRGIESKRSGPWCCVVVPALPLLLPLELELETGE